MSNPLKDVVTRLSHSITIRAGGRAIGAIYELSEDLNVGLKPLYGLGTFEQPGQYGARSGDPYEIAPGNMQPIKLSISRYDLVTSLMEEAFGTGFDLTILSNQDVGLDIVQIERRRDGSSGGIAWRGCWFETLGRKIGAEGDRVISVSATIQATTKQVIA